MTARNAEPVPAKTMSGVRASDDEWASLMREAMAGHAPAYDRLLRAVAGALRPAIRRGLTRAGRDAGEAEDIVQEVLLAVHLKRHTWDPGQPLGPWLRAIGRNKLIDALRRRGRRIDVPIEDVIETLPADEPKAELAESEMQRHLGVLPAGQRDVVRAISIDGQSIAEAAMRFRMTAGAVRVALHRGLSQLARQARRDD